MGPLESKLSLRFRGRRITSSRITNIQQDVPGAEAQLGKVLGEIAAAIEDLSNSLLDVAREIDDLRTPITGGKDDS